MHERKLSSQQELEITKIMRLLHQTLRQTFNPYHANKKLNQLLQRHFKLKKIPDIEYFKASTKGDIKNFLAYQQYILAYKNDKKLNRFKYLKVISKQNFTLSNYTNPCSDSDVIVQMLGIAILGYALTTIIAYSIITTFTPLIILSLLATYVTIFIPAIIGVLGAIVILTGIALTNTTWQFFKEPEYGHITEITDTLAQKLSAAIYNHLPDCEFISLDRNGPEIAIEIPEDQLFAESIKNSDDKSVFSTRITLPDLTEYIKTFLNAKQFAEINTEITDGIGL
jgi:hypothetical protein